jgi:hypothetical protein
MASTARSVTAARSASTANAAAAAKVAAPRTSASRAGRSWAGVGFVVAGFVLVAGWFLPTDRYLTPTRGAGYALGILGGSLMLLLLIYPARKRIAGLRFLGSARGWFRFHMALGIIGPLCILYHSNYHLGATNSNVALFCMLIVAGSGLIGRYLYTRIHHGLYGRQATLTELRADAERLRSNSSGATRLLPELVARVDAGEKAIGTGVPGLPAPLVAVIRWRSARGSVRRYINRTLARAAAGSEVMKDHRRALARAALRYADARLSAARRVAEFEGCSRLFALWHVLHIPLFVMLLFAGIAHVIAVNVY